MEYRRFFQCLFVLVLAIQAHGQNLPTGHADVWKNIESHWQLWAERDLDGFLGYYHDRFSGWDYKDALTIENL